MRIRMVKSLKGGEKLAESVITEENETLISKGTVLKPEYLDLISFLGIDTVYIEDPYEFYETPHQIIGKDKKEAYIKEVQRILEGHIYHGTDNLESIIPLAKDIVKNLLDADMNTVIDMCERDGNLYEHTVMVTILTIMAARKLNVGEERLEQIAMGCLLHDLGLRYITVPYVNYDLDNRSTSEVFEFKKHTILAYSALEGEEWLEAGTKKMILSHHERKDGSGFPLKQKVKELECNILQVCDTFDCFISGMECRRTGIQETLEYLVESSDLMFDRKVVKVVQEMVAYYPVGTRVRLNTSEVGIVLSQTSDSIRPVIGVLDAENLMTNVKYNLEKDRNVFILQVEE